MRLETDGAFLLLKNVYDSTKNKQGQGLEPECTGNSCSQGTQSGPWSPWSACLHSPICTSVPWEAPLLKGIPWAHVILLCADSGHASANGEPQVPHLQTPTMGNPHQGVPQVHLLWCHTSSQDTSLQMGLSWSSPICGDGVLVREQQCSMTTKRIPCRCASASKETWSSLADPPHLATSIYSLRAHLHEMPYCAIEQISA